MAGDECGNYLTQHHKAVCVELPSMKRVLHKPYKAHKMLSATLFKIHVQ